MSFLFRAKRIALHQISAAAIEVVAAPCTNDSSRCSEGFPERPRSPETSILQIPSSRQPVSDRVATPKPLFAPLDFVLRIRQFELAKLPGAAQTPPRSFRLRPPAQSRCEPLRGAAV